MKLDIQHKHILKLVNRDTEEDGWTPISEQLYSALSNNMPKELIEFEKLFVGGRAKLTEEGKSIIEAMKWL